MTHTVTPSSMPTDAAVSGETARRRGWGWLLLVPGMLYLLVFFVYPTVQLFLTSLYDPSGSYVTGYTMTWHFANYVTTPGTSSVGRCGTPGSPPRSAWS